MKITEAIARIDKIKTNPYERSEKLFWLSELDSMVKEQILDTHAGSPAVALPYTDDTPADQALLIPAPYDQAYLWWLGAQMDYHNGEFTRYNNAIALFQNAYQAFADSYHRRHRPVTAAPDFH